ncbi:MAG TPA: recombination protein O N-terminal domain-containing protein [Candidatus Paceibacterota bacterium]
MYHKYNTEGIVMRGSERGEASRSVNIFTKEFGIIYASVQSARSINSKLRSSTTDFAEGNITLLRGRNEWKVVGAENRKNLFYTLDSSQKRAIASRVFLLLSKITGEEKNTDLYEIVSDFLLSLEKSSEQAVDAVERLGVLKILKNQGLVSESEEELEQISKDAKRAIVVINNSLKAVYES